MTASRHPIPSRSNQSAIDVFRGAAALTVASYHTREFTWVGMREFWHEHGLQASPTVLFGYLTFPLVWGSIGVPIFFVVSGYCIHRRQAFTRNRIGRYPLSIADFLMRRFFRIYPVLFGALIITFVCDYLGRRYFHDSYNQLIDTGVRAFLINLASLQGVAGPCYGSNGALWTLSLEVQFYLLYPLLLILMFRLGRLGTLAVLVALNVISYFALQRSGYTIFSSYYVSWYLGALVAEYEVTGVPTSARFHARCYAVAVLLFSAGCALFFSNAYAALQVWAIAFSVFLYSFLRSKILLVGWISRLFAWLGTFSFSLYIIHVPVVALINSILFNSVRQSSLAPFIAILTGVVGCAYAFSLVCERPALALSQAWKGKRESVRGVTAPVA